MSISEKGPRLKKGVDTHDKDVIIISKKSHYSCASRGVISKVVIYKKHQK
jgi:hypothetical protein